MLEIPGSHYSDSTDCGRLMVVCRFADYYTKPRDQLGLEELLIYEAYPPVRKTASRVRIVSYPCVESLQSIFPGFTRLCAYPPQAPCSIVAKRPSVRSDALRVEAEWRLDWRGRAAHGRPTGCRCRAGLTFASGVVKCNESSDNRHSAEGPWRSCLSNRRRFKMRHPSG